MGARRARVVAAVIAAGLAVAACGTDQDSRVTLSLATVSSPPLQDAIRAYRDGRAGRPHRRQLPVRGRLPGRRAHPHRRRPAARHHRRLARQRQRDGRPPDRAARGARGPLGRAVGARAAGRGASADGHEGPGRDVGAGQHGDRRDLQPRDAARGRGERPAHVARVAGGVREAQAGRRRPDRRRQPDVVGHAADRLRARALDRLRRPARPRAGDARRPRDVRELRLARDPQPLHGAVGARLLSAEPERDHDRAPGGAGRTR